MQTSARLACFIAALGLSIFSASVGTAAAKTIFLNNSSGGDGAGCGAPTGQACRTLQFAADSAAAGDTLLMVNPGDYGPATITKTLSIEGGIAGAGVFAPGNKPCIDVTAGAGNDVVIREFTCDQRSTKEGIGAGSGANLTLDHVLIIGNNIGGLGIVLAPPGKVKASLFVRDSTVQGFVDGISVIGGETTAVLHNVTVESCGIGIEAGSATGGHQHVSLEGSTVSLNDIAGIESAGISATVNVSNTLVTLNKEGLHHPGGGALLSLGGNSLAGNTTNGTFTNTENPK